MSKVLEEDYDEDYEPTIDEIEEYGQFLGMNPKSEKHLLWIARESLKAKLPPDWKPCQTGDGNIYYFNFKTGASSWDHPCDEYYKELYHKILKEGDPKGEIKRNEEQKRKAAASTKPSSASHSFVPKIPDTKSSDSASSKSPVRHDFKKSPPKTMIKINSIDDFELSDSSGDKKIVKPVMKPLPLEAKALPSLKMATIPILGSKPVLDDVDDFDSDDNVPKTTVSKQTAIPNNLKEPIQKTTILPPKDISSILSKGATDTSKTPMLDIKSTSEEKLYSKPSLLMKPGEKSFPHSSVLQPKADDIDGFDSSSEESKPKKTILEVKPMLKKESPSLAEKGAKTNDFPLMQKQELGQAKLPVSQELEAKKKELEQKTLEELQEFEKGQQRKVEQRKEELANQYNRKFDQLQDEQELNFTRKQNEVLQNFKIQFNSFQNKYALLFDSVIEELIHTSVTFSMDNCDIELKPIQTEYKSADKIAHELQTGFVTLVKQKYSQSVDRLKEKTKKVLDDFEVDQVQKLDAVRAKKRKEALSVLSQTNDMKIYKVLQASDAGNGYLRKSVGDFILAESDIEAGTFTGYNLTTQKEGKLSINSVELADLKREARDKAEEKIRHQKVNEAQIEAQLEDRKLEEKRYENSLKFADLQREYEEKLKRYDQDILDLQKEQVEKYNSTKAMWDRRLHDLETLYEAKLETIKKSQEIAKEQIEAASERKTPKLETFSFKDDNSHSYYKGKPLLSYTPDDFDVTNDNHLEFSSSSSISEFEKFSTALKMEGKHIRKTKEYLYKQKQDIADVLADTDFDERYKERLGLGVRKEYDAHPNIINIHSPMPHLQSPGLRSEYPDINVNLHSHEMNRQEREIIPKLQTEIDSRVEKQNSYLQQIEEELNQLTKVLKQKTVSVEPSARHKSYAAASIRNRRGNENIWKKEQKRTEAVVIEHQDWLNQLPNKLIL
ncbi:hypothetical protein HDV01_003436 [Terramyces sp. JEL0728]|nr:hypothetical protein HDV01_003436 [Terramyces sp. JEL0728]